MTEKDVVREIMELRGWKQPQLAKEAGINSEDDVMDMLSEIDREELYAKLKQGLEDVEQGKTTPLSEALDEIKEMLEKRRKEIEK